MTGKTIIALVKTDNRASGIPTAINLLKHNPVNGTQVFLKPNFNTADAFPGSTHNDTLHHLVLHLKAMGAKTITVGDRSGPADTIKVIQEKEVDLLCRDLGVELINFEALPPEGWKRLRPEKSHWRSGFDFASPVLDAECIEIVTGDKESREYADRLVGVLRT